MQHFPGIALPEIFEHRHRLWFCGLHICKLALGIRKKLCAFFSAAGLLSREDTEDSSALLNRDDTVNVDSIYGDELRIDHIYRSLNKCNSFTCPSELRSFAVIVRGFVSRLFNHRLFCREKRQANTKISRVSFFVCCGFWLSARADWLKLDSWQAVLLVGGSCDLGRCVPAPLARRFAPNFCCPCLQQGACSQARMRRNSVTEGKQWPSLIWFFFHVVPSGAQSWSVFARDVT